MAEPVVTKDIEDVVSSVRRLVAPEASPRPMSRDLGAERLILTPAFRVVSDDRKGPNAPTEMQTETGDEPAIVEAEAAVSPAVSSKVDDAWEDDTWSEVGVPESEAESEAAVGGR
ncbi:MAG: hypothetical protein B7Z31_15940 [Rhodobacterales bacterium 12-65-15]|nr:MAG: hypothetical protein B7Z31_15940 [Rhodobacterales bacterium 12-65-15]